MYVLPLFQGLRATSSSLSPLEGTAPCQSSQLSLGPHLSPILLVCTISSVSSRGRISAVTIATTETPPDRTSRLLFAALASPSTAGIRNSFLLCHRHLKRTVGPAAAPLFSCSLLLHPRDSYFSRKEKEGKHAEEPTLNQAPAMPQAL